MKKKLLSLLLVIAILVSSVSMGLSVFAAHPTGATGKGAEAYSAFSLVDNTKNGITGTEFGTTITIKSTKEGYKIKVNSVTATIRYADDDTGTVGSVNVQNTVAGAVCDTTGKQFNVSGSIDDGKAGLIRYECNYDLLDANGNVVVDSDRNVLKGLTGYGYGYVSANGSQEGTTQGTRYAYPGHMRDGSYFYSLDTLYPVYVQIATLNYYYRLRTQSGSSQSAVTRGVQVISGNAPSTLKTMPNNTDTSKPGKMQWPKSFWSERITDSDLWLTMTEPPSGYYVFTISFNSWEGDSWKDPSNITESTTMYYRRATDMNSALSAATTALNKNLEKSYYTAESWNEYIKALEYAQLAGRAYPQHNNPFRIACQNAASASSLIAEAEKKLVHGPADWSEVVEAYLKYFVEVEEGGSKKSVFKSELNVTTVYTYSKGETTYGTTTIARYTPDAINDYTTWTNEGPYAHFNAQDIYRYEQARVDDYTAEFYSRFNNLACNNAVYTYLDIAINEYEEKRANHEATENRLYTESTWSAYEKAVNDAKALSRNLKTDSQDTINSCLEKIIESNNQLKFGPADKTELEVQIERAVALYTDYDNGKVLTALEGFDALWTDFEADYNVAKSINDNTDYTMDKQANVESAAEELRMAIEALSGYRLLDTTKLKEVTDTIPTDKNKYVPESYNAWVDLWLEGMDFLDKAESDYTGDDRKTYDDYDDMERLIEAIDNAYRNLEKIKADFTEIDGLIKQISEIDLTLYKEEVVEELKDAVAEIDYGANIDEQDSVDAVADKIAAALAKLTYDNLKGADYDAVDAAIAKANALDRNRYENFSSVDDAINAVDRTKKIIEQGEVDAMAEAINDAIDNLQFIRADYTEVDKAIARAEEYEANKHWYSNYYRVENAINAVDRNKDLSKQAEVDAMAKAINDAIDNLIEAGADYSGVEDAMADYNALAPLSDFLPETLVPVDTAISNVNWKLNARDQEQVNAMEAAIRAAMEKMVLKGADYSSVNFVIAHAQSLDRNLYTNFNIVDEAIGKVDWTLNCRQIEELQQQAKLVSDALEQLKFKSADYTKVDEEIEAAEYAYKNGEFPYTEESIQKVKDAIESVNRDLDITQQGIVDGYVQTIKNAVAGLTYVRADYTDLDKLLEEYEALDRDLYVSLLVIDAYVSKIDKNLTVDKQDQVETYEDELRDLLDSLEFAPADYSDVKYQIDNYKNITRDFYEEDALKEVDDAVNNVVYGIKMNEQEKVDDMAEAIRIALANLKDHMKKANREDLLDAVEKANARIDEMNATGHKIDQDTLRALRRLLTFAETNYGEGTTIDKQDLIDETTANIIEATANLEFEFKIILKDPIVIDEYGYIYGFEEGTNSADARELIDFVGAAEFKIYETKNGFGTGTMIQFTSTKDGSILGTYTVIVFGDANGDAVIDTFDDAYLSELINEGVSGEGMLLKTLDFDQDGYLTVTDLAIMTDLANLNKTLMQDGTMVRY